MLRLRLKTVLSAILVSTIDHMEPSIKKDVYLRVLKNSIFLFHVFNIDLTRNMLYKGFKFDLTLIWLTRYRAPNPAPRWLFSSLSQFKARFPKCPSFCSFCMILQIYIRNLKTLTDSQNISLCFDMSFL